MAGDNYSISCYTVLRFNFVAIGDFLIFGSILCVLGRKFALAICN